MKVNSLYTAIPKDRKVVIDNCMKEFNKQFQSDAKSFYAPLRNKVAIPAHLFIAGLLLSVLANVSGVLDVTVDLLLAKLNMDFVPMIDNINKIKASAFSRYMRNNGITDEKELLYGTKKYLTRSGSAHYPILHPDKTKRMAETSEYTRSFETGIVAIRTDKKALCNKLLKRINKK